ncbi:deoxyguanosinetriphosphate triphosphohydrolase, partial [Bordetella pertussis]
MNKDGTVVLMNELASYASDPSKTRGRRHSEPPPENRTEFQRDRDRIIHSNAFRRLEYKTQVFVNHEGDLFRTRLTHSLEVAQIARTLARSLRVSEDLTEAIALAHDLGHTPFGHAGQDELNACMRELAPQAGGFEHNLQSLRVVDELEERYAEFNGLNLCFETREGILKHCSATHARQLGAVGERFLDRTQPSLEAQLANLADEVAYNNHDVDDGLRSGLITLEQLQEVGIFARHYAEVARRYPQLAPRRATSETIRRMINTLIVDLTATSLARIRDHAPASADAWSRM